jgi:hypothetical protein
MQLILPCLLAGLFLCFNSSAQILDDFSDGDLTHHPVWQPSDESDWIVNTSGQLQSNRQIPNSSFWLTTPQTLADSVQWEIDVYLNTNPSSLNYMDIYLISSQPEPNNNELAGYFIRMGNTEDEISLYRKDPGNKIVKIIDGENGLLNKSSNTFRIKAVRRKNQEWSVFYDASMTGNEYRSAGQVNDQTYQSGQYFILMVQQSTASFFQKHLFDNISVKAFIPDTIPPTVESARVESPNNISIGFSEMMNKSTTEILSNYQINNGIGQPKSIFQDSSKPNQWIMVANESFESGKRYLLTIKNLDDENGNRLADTTMELLYYTPQQNDIILNEILFDPKSAGSDYIELYNRSAFPVNLKNFKLANRNTVGIISYISLLFQEDYILAPDEHLVFTEDSLNIKSTFYVKHPEKLKQRASLPSMPNDKGTILLLDNANNIMDELSYDEDWHLPLLDQREGVSLERINPNKPSQDPDNWLSASKTSGYGTPTTKNSQQYTDKSDKENIQLSSKIFSPDQDGQDDLLLILYSFPEGGYILNTQIFDIYGRPVRVVQKQMLCGLSGSFRWDGLDDMNKQLPVGHYIVMTEVFNLRGKVKRFKEEVILARRW